MGSCCNTHIMNMHMDTNVEGGHLADQVLPLMAPGGAHAAMCAAMQLWDDGGKAYSRMLVRT